MLLDIKLEYYAAIERTDTYIGILLQSIKDAGIEKNTVVLFTADHGGVGKEHGEISMNEMQIPWIVKGPRILKNKELTESVMTFDTAATIADFLKLRTPQVWIGRPVQGIFK